MGIHIYSRGGQVIYHLTDIDENISQTNLTSNYRNYLSEDIFNLAKQVPHEGYMINLSSVGTILPIVEKTFNEYMVEIELWADSERRRNK